MMTKLSTILSGILLISISASAIADKPPGTGKPPEECKPTKPEKPAKPEKPQHAKAALMHCGCNSDGTGLEWNYLVVSSKSKGHRKHQAGDIVECYVPDVDEDVLEGTYTRDDKDCTIDEGTLLEVDQCGSPVPMAGESCGSEYIAPEPE